MAWGGHLKTLRDGLRASLCLWVGEGGCQQKLMKGKTGVWHRLRVRSAICEKHRRALTLCRITWASYIKAECHSGYAVYAEFTLWPESLRAGRVPAMCSCISGEVRVQLPRKLCCRICGYTIPTLYESTLIQQPNFNKLILLRLPSLHKRHFVRMRQPDANPVMWPGYVASWTTTRGACWLFLTCK